MTLTNKSRFRAILHYLLEAFNIFQNVLVIKKTEIIYVRSFQFLHIRKISHSFQISLDQYKIFKKGNKSELSFLGYFLEQLKDRFDDINLVLFKIGFDSPAIITRQLSLPKMPRKKLANAVFWEMKKVKLFF